MVQVLVLVLVQVWVRVLLLQSVVNSLGVALWLGALMVWIALHGADRTLKTILLPLLLRLQLLLLPLLLPQPPQLPQLLLLLYLTMHST